jgi:hypothetical protein
MNPLYTIRRTMSWLRRQAKPMRVQRIVEEPDVLDAYVLYLVGNREYPWAVMFTCPCGCAARIALNLVRDTRPCWRERVHIDGTVSLFPSIDRTVGCRSHFWVRRGIVHWVPPRRR